MGKKKLKAVGRKKEKKKEKKEGERRLFRGEKKVSLEKGGG